MYLGIFIKISGSSISLTSAECLENSQCLIQTRRLQQVQWRAMIGRAVLGINLRASSLWATEIHSTFSGEQGIRKRSSVLVTPRRKRRVRDGSCLWVEEDEGCIPKRRVSQSHESGVCVCVEGCGEEDILLTAASSCSLLSVYLQNRL